ncbi:PilZ domain-containing protein [Sphingomonas sp.]|uniref:PilZ domain-containing protein n=1 Tax=Sphingomonas sp. TaxID=28214 RepID=UPI0025ED7888|nr:PilZ domain-containing protein [Sphingomonas sp.]MBV9527604.1 PilZ domain-containing protein [Sphingomonas sp.]
MHRGQGWVGRKDRHDVDFNAIVVRDDGAQLTVKLTNLSPDGCRLVTDETFRIGEHVSIAFSRVGHLRARVRWALPGSAGTQFIDEDGGSSSSS